MIKTKSLHISEGLRQRALGAVRPGVEAMLLAAVALGCAQAGWSVLTPGSAGASNAVSDERDGAGRVDLAEVQSPFAPEAAGAGAGSHAIAALISSLELDGVRTSLDHSRSGAMFTIAGGEQRAFMIGDEIADGVTLADVSADYVLLAYDGGQRRLDMDAAPSFSFARAMMGLEPAPGAPQQHAVAAAQPAPAVSAPAAPSEADRAWLAATLANVEIDAGAPRGWRVGEAAPEAVIAAGVRPGDLILSVNGAGPDNLAAIAAAAQAERIELIIDRGGERMTLVVDGRA